MRVSRLLSLLILLQLRQRVTAESLAQEFGISVRTVYRDIDALSAAGVPVYADRGPGGGFQLVDGYRTRLTGVAPHEAEAAFLLGLPDVASQLGLAGASDQFTGKVLASLPGQSAEWADRLRKRFHVDHGDWYRASPPVTHLPALARAVLDECVVRIDYESWSARKQHRLQPLGLVLKGGNWYLVARNARERVLNFKVSSILALEVSEERFTPPAKWNLSQHWQQSLEEFERRLRPESMVLRIQPVALHRLRDAGDFAARAVQAAEQLEDESLRVNLPVENAEQAARLVLSLLPGAEVEGPANIRKEVERLATMALKAHRVARKAPQSKTIQRTRTVRQKRAPRGR